MELNHHRGGTGDPLVLIHGVGSQWQMWAPVLDRLERERDVIAIDLAGHGGSPPLPAGIVPSAPAHARIVADFLDEIGVERAAVGGNSLGGWIALELAKLGRASAVAALSPAGFFVPLEAALSRWQLKANALSSRRARPVIEQLLVRPRGRKLALGSVIVNGDRVTASEGIAMTRNLAASTGFEPTLETITHERFTGGDQVRVPVSLVWGSRDLILFPWQAKRALAELPDARHVPVPGTGHVPTWDAPDTVTRELLAL